MTAAHTLIATGITEAALLVVVVVLLAGHRAYATRRRRIAERERARITTAVSRWLMGDDPSGDGLARALESRDRSTALRQLLVTVSAHVPAERRDELAAVVRRGPWAAELARYARSPFWWRRLDAARVLAITATEPDAAAVARLVSDPHPAVRTAAVRCLLRVAEPSIVTAVLDRLPDQPATIRVMQAETLRQLWPVTVPLLAERLRRADAPPRALEAWILFADTVGAHEALEPVIALHAHPDANVRVATARALRRCFHPDAAAALTTLLRDPDWRARGQAARGLGALAVGDAIPQLREALGDSSWWVRFRAALALAQMQEPGRRALRESRSSPDRFVSDMAVMVSGLSDGSITELTEA